MPESSRVADADPFRHSASASSLDPAFDHNVFVFAPGFSGTRRISAASEGKEEFVLIVRPEWQGRSRAIMYLASIGTFLVFAAIVSVLGVVITNGTVAMAVASAGFGLGFVGAIVVAMMLSPKRNVGVYSSAIPDRNVLHVVPDRRIHFPVATYMITDDNYALLGVVRANHLRNLFRKRWSISDSQGAFVALVMEDSVVGAFLRRLWRIGRLVRAHFNIFDADGRDLIGVFRQLKAFDNKYTLDMTTDRERSLDIRLAIGTAVLLDVAEQNLP